LHIQDPLLRHAVNKCRTCVALSLFVTGDMQQMNLRKPACKCYGHETKLGSRGE